MYSPTVHCTSCSTAITLASWHPTPTYCPFCGSTTLQPDEAYQQDLQLAKLQHEVNRWANGKLDHLPVLAGQKPILWANDDPSTWTHTLTLTPQLLDVLRASFRTQHAFISFTEYVVCTLTAKPPASRQEREQDERQRASLLR